MDSIRVLFFGTTVFSASVLSTLVAEGWNVVAVVSQPDRPVGRKHILQAPPVKQFALEHGITVLQPDKLSSQVQEVCSYKPDLIVSCAYGQYIPSSIFSYPHLGSLNIHPSALPKYRGGAPIQRAVMNGDHSTEVCLMEVAEKMDSGAVFARIPYEIDPEITAGELFEALKAPAKQLITEYLPLYVKGELQGEAQNEADVVYAPNIAREEELVLFSKEDGDQLYNHLRGLLEAPMGYGILNGKRVKFARVRKEQTESKELPGTILGFEQHAMRIAMNRGVLLVYELQMEGKSRMSADAFYNGAGRQLIGSRFE